MAIFPGSAIPSAVSDDYEIENSVRFNDNDSASLKRTPTTAGNRRTWTVSFWVKRSEVVTSSNPGDEMLFTAENGGDEFYIRWGDGGTILNVYNGGSSPADSVFKTTQSFNDPSAWYHIVFAADTTQPTSSDRCKLYVNGEQVTAFSVTNYPAEDTEWVVNGTYLHTIGSENGTGMFYDGYMAEFYLIDGTALTPSDFGELDSTTNQWIPLDSDDVKDAVTFGTNGFYQKYNSTELGASFADSAPHTPHTMTAHNGAVTKTAQKKFGTASYYGSADTMCLTTPASEDWNFGTGDFTVELWARFNTLAADMEFFTHRDSLGSGDWALWWDNPSQGLRWEFYPSNIAQGSHSGWSVDTWYHIAAVRSSGVVTLYRDGVSIASGACTTDFDCDAQLVVAEETGGASGNEGFQGYLDEIRISKGVARYVGEFTPPTAPFTADQYTKLLLHCDGSNDGTTFTDSADSAPAHTITATNAVNQRPQHHNVTANGNAHLIGPKQGTSVISYDGTGDYLSIPDSSDWDFGTDSFTIEMWLNTRDSTTENGAVFSHYTDANNHHEIYLYDNVIYWQCLSGGSHVFTGLAASTVVTPENGWAHYAFVRNSTTFTIYKDGVSEDSTTDSDSIPAQTAALEIGKDGSGNYYTGYIDSYRISDSARYTADFTAPTSAFTNDGNTKLLIQSGTDGSQTFDDLSTPDHTITANGDVRWFAPKVGAGAMVFDGTGDYFSVPDSVDWDFGAGDFTIEFWAKIGASAPDGSMLSHYDVSSQRSWSVVLDATNNELEFVYSTDGSSATTAAFSWSYSEHTWYLVSICRSGADLKAFIDGTQIGSTHDISTSDLHNSTSTLTIGGDVRSGMGYLFKGAIDDLRIVRTALRTSNWTASTSAFTDSINTVLLLNADINQGTWAEDSSTGLAISTESRMKFDGSGDYLNIPNSTDWQFSGQFTIEGWVKKPDMATVGDIFTIYGGGGGGGNAGFQIFVGNNAGGSGINCYFSSDGSAWTNVQEDYTWANGTWYHLAITRDGSNVVHIWVNGTEVGSGTSFTGTVADPAAYDTLSFGARTDTSSNQWDGYMDEIRISDTARYTASFTPQTRGNPFTADANTLLLIHSDYTGGLGADSSGNYNNFTATNLVATDQMIDTPTNNFCTINPLDQSLDPAFSEGNLKIATVTTNTQEQAKCTVGVTSGKWYFECLMGGSGNNQAFGIATDTSSVVTWFGGDAGHWTYQSEGKTNNDGNETSTGYTSYTGGDIVQVALDMDNGKVWFGKNNTWQTSGDPSAGTNAAYSSGISGKVILPMVGVYQSGASMTTNFGQDSSFAGAKTAQGNSDSGTATTDFYYEPPSGFLALCTDNLSTPEIKLPGEYFNTVLYTGTGSDQSITGAGLEPDLVWIKSRNATYNHNLLDSVRGPHSWIGSNSTAEEDTDANAYLSSFDSDGFTLDGGGGSTNNSGTTYVSWNWKAAGTASSNTDGSITSTVSANTSAGFSIVKYTGNDTNLATYGHGLSQAPEMVITKALTEGTYYWQVYHTGLTSFDYALFLNETNAENNNTNRYKAISASTVQVGTDGGLNADEDYIAYCFHSVEGYSKVGSYEGNGNVDGTFIYTGFEPAFVITKRTDSSGDWVLLDVKRNTYNEMTYQLMPNANYAEGASSSSGTYRSWTTKLDMVSNGFKHRWAGDAGISVNVDGGDYIYIAFAESPFKYSNAR